MEIARVEFGSLILPNDFVVAGSAGEHILDPIWAIDEVDLKKGGF